LFVSAFRRADELAVAMECRCYRGGKGRTKLHVLHICASDVFWVLSFVVLGAALILINIYGVGYTMGGVI
jgi:energy-coupling factor transport system permease protein